MLSRLCSLLRVSGHLLMTLRDTHSASLTCCASFDLCDAERTCSAFRWRPDRVGSSVHSCCVNCAKAMCRAAHVDYTGDVGSEDLRNLL